jgi:hypothetical protein
MYHRLFKSQVLEWSQSYDFRIHNYTQRQRCTYMCSRVVRFSTRNKICFFSKLHTKHKDTHCYWCNFLQRWHCNSRSLDWLLVSRKCLKFQQQAAWQLIILGVKQQHHDLWNTNMLDSNHWTSWTMGDQDHYIFKTSTDFRPTFERGCQEDTLRSFVAVQIPKCQNVNIQIVDTKM